MDGLAARQIGVKRWVGWQTNRWMDRWIGCEIDKNRWGVGHKVALGQQVGGIGGQSIVGGDGSPGWVVITRSGAHVHEKLENLMKLMKKRSCWVKDWQMGDGTRAIQRRNHSNGWWWVVVTK